MGKKNIHVHNNCNGLNLRKQAVQLLLDFAVTVETLLTTDSLD